MILIADSGSTKTSWKLADNTGIKAEVTTLGMNPFFRTTDDIIGEFEKTVFPVAGEAVTHIWFYGAGVVNAEKGGIIKSALLHFYPSAAVDTQSDLLGACRALHGNKKGIACIVGTGSNACYFDGKNIASHISPLGFILGDEGSGAVMGKHLLGDYFKEVMPESLRIAFNQRFGLTRDEALNRVYREPRPSQFLASFTPFLFDNREHEYCKTFVEQNFRVFIERNITKLPGYRGNSVGFVGSVAWYFSDIMKEILKSYGITDVLFLKDPIDGLVKFHIQN